jgi:hypothetical protein
MIYTINPEMNTLDKYNIRKTVLFLLEDNKIDTNVFLLSLIYYERINGSPNSLRVFWSWIGVLILADCFLNDKPYSNNSWAEYFKKSKKSIVKQKKTSLISLEYSLFCTDIEYKSMVKRFETSC